ncbi:hypothetical protein NC652_015440 [Populus alba x Populus x berolinensis]|nr:hypothetical protein NC652_015440 [Populus alba x Populus x berolinensis]
MIGKREGNLYKAFGYIHFIFVPHLDFVRQSSASCDSYEKNTKICVFFMRTTVCCTVEASCSQTKMVSDKILPKHSKGIVNF